MIKQNLSKRETYRNVVNLLDVYTTAAQNAIADILWNVEGFSFIYEKDENDCYLYLYFTLLKVPASNEEEMKQIGKEGIIIIQIW